jgi:hypothetical protein
MDIKLLMQQFNCPVATSPCTYLGNAPSRLNRIHYQPILDKSVKKLSGWKLPMSIEGCLILVKVVLCGYNQYPIPPSEMAWPAMGGR